MTAFSQYGKHILVLEKSLKSVSEVARTMGILEEDVAHPQIHSSFLKTPFKHLDFTTMFSYSHASQAIRACMLS